MTLPHTSPSQHRERFLHGMIRFGLVTSLLSAFGFMILIALVIAGDGSHDAQKAFLFGSIGLGIIGQIAQDIVIVPRIFSRVPWHVRLPLVLLLIPACNLVILFYLLGVEIVRFFRRRSAAHGKRVVEAALESGAEIPANFAHMPAAGAISSVSAAISPATILLPIVVAIASVGIIGTAVASPVLLSPAPRPPVAQVTPSPTVYPTGTLTDTPTATPAVPIVAPSATAISTATSPTATHVPSALPSPTPTSAPQGPLFFSSVPGKCDTAHPGVWNWTPPDTTETCLAGSMSMTNQGTGFDNVYLDYVPPANSAQNYTVSMDIFNMSANSFLDHTIQLSGTKQYYLQLYADGRWQTSTFGGGGVILDSGTIAPQNGTHFIVQQIKAGTLTRYIVNGVTLASYTDASNNFGWRIDYDFYPSGTGSVQMSNFTITAYP